MNETPVPEETVTFPEVARFEVREYCADGGFAFGSLLQLCGGLGVVGIILGAIAHFVGQYFWFILIFPALIGLGVGGAGAVLLRKLRVRNPIICSFAGLAAGVFAMTTMHYLDYRAFNDRMAGAMGAEQLDFIRQVAVNIEQFQQDRENLPEDLQLLVDDLLADPEALKVFQVNSFPAFMNYSAELGVELSHRGRKGMNLGYTGSIIYWLVEMLIVAGLGFVLMSSAAAQPFCVACHEWKKEKEYGPIPPLCNPQESLKEGRVLKYPIRGDNDPVQPGDWNVQLWTCDDCEGESGVDVILRLISIDDNKVVQYKDVEKISYPAEAVAPLVYALTRDEPAKGESAAAAEQEEDESQQA